MSECPDEAWKRIPGFSRYEVSSLGRTRTFIRPGKGSVEVAVPRDLRQHEKRGYLTVLMRDDSGKRAYPGVHTLVLAAFVGPRPQAMQACHGNGDRRDNRLVNLRWDTAAANGMDKVAHGTAATGLRNGAYTRPDRVRAGDEHGRSKLSSSGVVLLRFLRSVHGVSFRELGEWFGVSDVAARLAASGHTWRNV